MRSAEHPLRLRKGGRWGRAAGQAAPTPQAPCADRCRIAAEAGSCFQEVHSRPAAPGPVTVLLGTHFKEITQRAKDDSYKHLQLGYLYWEQLKVTSGERPQKPGGSHRGRAPCLAVSRPGGRPVRTWQAAASRPHGALGLVSRPPTVSLQRPGRASPASVTSRLSRHQGLGLMPTKNTASPASDMSVHDPPSPRCCVETLDLSTGTPSSQKPLTTWIPQVGSTPPHSPHSHGPQAPPKQGKFEVGLRGRPSGSRQQSKGAPYGPWGQLSRVATVNQSVQWSLAQEARESQ